MRLLLGMVIVALERCQGMPKQTPTQAREPNPPNRSTGGPPPAGATGRGVDALVPGNNGGRGPRRDES